MINKGKIIKYALVLKLTEWRLPTMWRLTCTRNGARVSKKDYNACGKDI